MRIAAPENTIDQQVQVLRLLRKHGPQTRREIATLTGHSLSLVRQLTQDLALRGLVVESGIAPSDAPGRPSQVWSLAPDACLAVGVDVGGVSTRAVVLDTLGQVILRYSIHTAQAESSAALLDEIAHVISYTLETLGPQRDAVRGVGIAFSGFVDYKQGRSLDAPNIPHAQALPLQERLADMVQLPIRVDDSSRAMALAEMRYGAAQNSENFICVNVGAGIGTGVIINRQLYRGSLGLAGELGHIQVMPNGQRCRCGRRGCLETLASGGAIADQARYLLESHMPSKLRDLCGDDPSRVNAEIVTRAALEGDALAQELIQDAGAWLGVGLAIVINLFSPDMIVLTGGVIRNNRLLHSIVQRETDQRILPQLPQPFPIVLTALDEYVGALGAATLILDEAFERGFTERLSAEDA